MVEMWTTVSACDCVSSVALGFMVLQTVHTCFYECAYVCVCVHADSAFLIP